MAKWMNDTLLDAPLDRLATNATQELLCSAQPTDRANALAIALASVNIASGDWTKANGDVDGRKSTLAAKSGATASASGNGNHIAIISASELMEVTTCDLVAVTSGVTTVNFPAWDTEYGDPT